MGIAIDLSLGLMTGITNLNQYNSFATAAYEIYFFRIVDDPEQEKFPKCRLRSCPIIPMAISTFLK
jgi:hypothetical protein